MANLKIMKGAASVPKKLRSQMDTILLTPDEVEKWERPPFQREFRRTKKVVELVGELKAEGGVVPGILTLGKLDGKTYLIDGQHRVAAFLEAALEEGIADVRICHFDSMADMGEEFVKLNSALVRMRNEDFLRGLEGVNPYLADIRRRCPFIGYDHIRHEVPGSNGARVMISMAVAVRTWFGSVYAPTAGPGSTVAATMLDDVQVGHLCDVMTLCFEAWGRDKENYRLWGALNLATLMWMYRRVVLAQGLSENRRGGVAIVRLTKDQFRSCLMGVSADRRYVEWLVGRGLGDRDKSPCFARLKDIFVRRIMEGGAKRPNFPQGEWQKS